ncbi:MAG: 4Fe-4S cluster-binding domain-containing protein [Clostridiales bacterium]|nr:4Fe-4S cluster-binding domain-containing protein [Clostridiales bacterium]
MGKIYKLESMSALDGPGLRYVVFLQGCPLRCDFCHNADCADLLGGIEMSAEEVFQKIERAIPYIKKNGGVTLSGGEPLFQKEFTNQLLSLCRKAGLHTAMETSGACDIGDVIDLVDLVILDIKADGRNRDGAEKLLLACEEKAVPVWLTQVVIPTRNDSIEKLRPFAQLKERFSCVQKASLLPYHTMGLNKWKGTCPIEHIPAMDKAKCKELEDSLFPKA